MPKEGTGLPPGDPAGECVEPPVDGPETVAEKRLLATLGRQARPVNLARVVRLLALLEAAEEGALDEAGQQEAENVAHQLIGSAGTFGHHSASEDAVVVEGYFAARRGRRGMAAGADVVRATLERLRSEFGG